MLTKLTFIHKMDVCYNFLSPMLNTQFLADVHINKIIRNFIICIIKLRSCLTVSNKRIPFIFYLTEVDDLRTVVGILKHRPTYLISLKKISVERTDPKNVKKNRLLLSKCPLMHLTAVLYHSFVWPTDSWMYEASYHINPLLYSFPLRAEYAPKRQ